MQLNFILLAVVLTSLVQFNTAQDNGKGKPENVTNKLEEKVLTTNLNEVENITTPPERTADQTKQMTDDNHVSQTESEETKDNLVGQTEKTKSKPDEGTTTTTGTAFTSKPPTWCSGIKSHYYTVLKYLKSSAPTIGGICIVVGAIYAVVAYA